MRHYTDFNSLAFDWDTYQDKLKLNSIALYRKKIAKLELDEENDNSQEIGLIKEWIAELENELN